MISGPLWVLFGALFCFGLLFNWIFNLVVSRDWAEGYVWLFVVVGVAATVGPLGLFISWEAVVIILIAFCSSGAPMALGDIHRHVSRRSKLLSELRELQDIPDD